MTALHVAGLSRDNPLEAARALIAAGADLHARSARKGWTPLHIAAALNHTPLVALLLDHGADPDAVANDRDEPTPLVGCLTGRVDLCLPTVEVLLARGADPNHVPPGRDGPLHMAVQCGNVPAIHRLVAAGADVDARSGNTMYGQRTPLLVAVNYRHDVAVDALLALGADVNATSAAGYTALHAAVLTEQPRHVRTLLDRGAAVNARANDGHTPLTAFLARRHRVTPLELVELLLAHGADPGLAVADGTPTLHLALYKGEAEVVRQLVAAGASVDQRDADGRSAVDVARDLPPLLQLALGVPATPSAVAPTRAFLERLASGETWSHGSMTLTQHADSFRWRPTDPPARLDVRPEDMPHKREAIREHVAWLAVHDDAAAAALVGWFSRQADVLGEPAWTVAGLRASLREWEAELVERVLLGLRPEHGPQIIEDAVRRGYVPCEHDREGIWTWTFVPDAPEDRAFQFKASGVRYPHGILKHTSAEALRDDFAKFTIRRGRLHWTSGRTYLDRALAHLGHETERQWLAAQATQPRPG